MIRSVSRISRQITICKLKNNQYQECFTNIENGAPSITFCQPNLTFYSSAAIPSSKNVENSNEDPSEIQTVLDQIEARHPGKLNASMASSMMFAIARSAPKDAFKEYFESSDSNKYPLMSSIIKKLESPRVDGAKTMELISALKSASILGIPSGAFAVQNIENTLTWRCRSATIRHLNQILSQSAKGKKIYYRESSDTR